MYTFSRLSGRYVLIGIVLAACALFPYGTANAAKAQEPSPSTPREVLALADAVLQALDRNLDITISRQNKQARLTDIIFEQAKFDPSFDLSGRYDRLITPLNRPIFGLQTGAVIQDEPSFLDQNQSTWKAGFSQNLITGGDYDLAFEPQRTFVAGDTRGFLFNEAWESNLTLNLSQPLLRDFGPDVNSTQIRIAKNNAQVEEHVFFDSVLTVISSVEQAYWELVFAREALKVAQIALKAAQELEASNSAKAQAGVMTIVDVLQAKAAVATRLEGVILAEKVIRDQEDQLRQLLNPSEQMLRRDVKVIPIDKPAVTLKPISLQESIDVAIEKRPEVLQASKNIETAKLNSRFAKNQLLPSLTLEGTGGLIGLGEDINDMNDRGTEGDFYNYGVGLVLSYPLGNRSAWSRYNRRKLEAMNAQTSLQSARQQVIINVREGVRRVQTDFKRIETTRSARILSEKQLNAEEERLNVGLSTTRLVLDFQRDLAFSQRNELRAIVDYNKSLSNLERQKGTTLQRYGIEFK